MIARSNLRRSFFLAAICLFVGSAASLAQDETAHRVRKFKTPPPSSRIEVTVVRDYNGKPVPDAHVIFHPIEGDKDKGALELKTNEDGKIVIDVIPVGDTVTLQVIANGFQTYGQVYKIDKLNMAMEVRLSRPTKQYSIYDHPGTDSGSSNNSDPNKNPDTGKPSGPPPSQPNSNTPPPQSN